MARDRVLVTGASGFIAKHIVLALLAEQFDVRGTVRGGGRADEVRAVVRSVGSDPERCEFVEADLGSDAGWAEAVAGCRYVLHTASPFPLVQPRRPDRLVELARQGTDTVLRAAARAGAERAVVTSSVAAVFYGYPRDRTRPFDERDFTDLTSRAVSPYARSKTVAELAAWEVSRETGLPLSTINPGLVLGPVLDSRLGTSAQLIASMMKGRLPLLPDIAIPSVDVRDVARAHVLAMLAPEAGRRFLLAAPETPSLLQLAAYLAEAFPDRSRRLPRHRLPSALVRLGALISPGAAMLADDLGRAKAVDTSPARERLGIQFIPAREAVVTLGESLARHGCV
ncbi:NAD-dependent epimerase/dehydratase family protein [uncultured Aureimonas sp.]|uniref:NAD-dependent epimerase/dehydratase family protein n=1 Tax=uncultured Aureimonas sp. TaxID=1604662 RepID=UPI0025EA543C|nr:NAD-dependent epimerase/dehydratase family protein [uncultured Aureimonas sp.]